jgi:hypothetical protein
MAIAMPGFTPSNSKALRDEWHCILRGYCQCFESILLISLDELPDIPLDDGTTLVMTALS